MAELDGPLWPHNLSLVRFVDVTDDYRLMQPPLPSEFYPVINEAWLPTFKLENRLPSAHGVDGYLYDWHERRPDGEAWFVGVVQADLSKG